MNETRVEKTGSRRMDKAHDIQHVSFSGTIMHLRVDGRDYQIDIAIESERLRNATQKQRENFEIRPAFMEFTGRMWMKICPLTDSSG
jgi:hypothetical protein